MESSETSRNDKSRFLKSLLIGLVLGAITGCRTYAIGSPGAMSKPGALGTHALVAWKKAVAASVGLSAWADKAIDYVFGPALPFTVGAFVTLTVSEALRAKKLFGSALIDRIWPGPPDFLDPKLERK